MRIITHTTIERPSPDAAALMANPAFSPKWMHDLESSEPLSGQPGKPGATTRLAFKNGMTFVSSVLQPTSPNELRLRLDGSRLTIHTTAQFQAVSPRRTTLRFEQVFEFEGMGRILGFVMRPIIKRQQQQHIQDFKQFAEQSLR